MSPKPPATSRVFPSFLLAQVGAHASSRFGDRLQRLGLTRPEAGILRLVGASGGLSQQRLAAALGIHPSRLVAILDELESKGLVERRPHPEDRRTYAIHLTDAGEATWKEVARVAREHNEALLAALKPREREELGSLLQAVADEQGLTPGVHPGYRRLGPRGAPRRR